MKLLCILLPHFPLRCEVLKDPGLAGHPALLTYAVGSEKLLLDFLPGMGGLERDMPLQQAVSRCDENVRFIHADMPHYWDVFSRILDALELRSPFVEGSELGDIYIGCDGLEGIYPGDAALAGAMRSAVPEAFEPRLGIAEGKFAARLAALNSPPGGHLSLTDDITSFLSGLSCDLLPVAPRTRGRLHEFGLHTLGELSALTLSQLQAQSPRPRPKSSSPMTWAPMV